MLSESFALESRVTTLDRVRDAFEENHYPPTTSAVNITIAVVLRGRTIVIGDPLSILSLSRRESSEFPPPTHRFLTCVHVTNTQDVPPDGSYRYASAIRTAVYYGSLSDMYLCFPYHFAIIDNIVKAFCRKQWVITCLCCSPVPLFLLLLSPCLRDSVPAARALSFLTSPDTPYVCLARRHTHRQDRYTPMPLLRDIRVYIS